MNIQSKVRAAILVLALMLTLIPASAYAVEAGDVETYTYVEDLGNDFTAKTTLIVSPAQERSSSKRVTKIQEIKHSGREIGTVKLVATFSYDGTTSRVTSTSYEKDISVGWAYTGHSITTSGGRATLTARLVSAIGTVPVNISIYCSPSGVIS